jgi:hypothetical protein
VTSPPFSIDGISQIDTMKMEMALFVYCSDWWEIEKKVTIIELTKYKIGGPDNSLKNMDM